ncbi:MAG: serine O-acetyltransferase, partial [Solirubrobacteraceae bacterium]|nr:serine O-acetyltransferase [Solirubrobacteraceae bacterium]
MLGLGTLARVAGELRRDIKAARDRDPAARGVAPAEILATWPGVHALLSHRVAHALFQTGVPLAPRALATASRTLTG